VPQLTPNPDWRPEAPFPDDLLPAAEMHRAQAALSAWPEYRPTALRSLPGLAKELGLGAVLCKDESGRFGAGGVKALGAPYGLQRILERESDPAAITAIAATDGNHGLAVGWAARRAGCRALIFVGRDVDDGRLARIRAVGADIEAIDGTYDDAVRAAEDRAAADPTARLVTDTDYEGTSSVCRDIMAGYTLLATEAWASGLKETPPTHVFLQCGVGGLASSIAAGLWRDMSPAVPRVVTVEPVAAACMAASLEAGRPVAVEGDLRTRMCGLSCGRLSLPAWNILSRAATAALTVEEQTAATLQREMNDGKFGDPPLESGETGISGIAGLAAAARDPEIRRILDLNAESHVFVINSEGKSP